MQVQELNPEELSRVLAEHFEPKESIAHWKREDAYYETSRLGWWWWRGNGYSCEPASYTDPEICVRLLKWLLARYKRAQAVEHWMVHIDQYGPAFDLERNIAEAALLATGWKG